MLGIDIVAISRIKKIHQKYGKKFLDKFLNENEQLLAKKPQTIAGFYAAKEALSKALGVGISKDFSFHDVEIYKDKFDAPKMILTDSTKQKFNIEEISLSISHDGGFCIAAVIIKTKN